MKRVASHALGCKVNQYESEAIAELFAERGYEIVGIEEKADIYVINTCTVTNFGDKKSRQLIRRVKRKNPDSIVAVVGCYAQTAPKEIQEMEGVNLVIGTKGRNQIVGLVEQYQKEQGTVCLVGEMKQEREFEELSIQKLQDRTRAYLKIQDGCSQFCSYCIIPYARGPIRSREEKEVLAEVNRLAENGYQEIVLTGIHVASYGKEKGKSGLLDLVEQVHQVEKIRRIRFSSIEPNLITEDFLDRLEKLPKVCPHFHLSLQSGCTKTLQAMNRKYTASQYEQAVALLRKRIPDVALTTDVIAGFPGETEEDFQECYDFVKKIGFAKVHVFPYSPKKGTPAAERTDQILNAVKAERTRRLLQLSKESSNLFLQRYLGRDLEVLFEREIEEGLFEGHTSNYIKVLFYSDIDLKNCLKTVKLEKISGEMIFAAFSIAQKSEILKSNS